ncbi:thiamine pyrophosphokinase [Rubricella aquisinus]|uniref:Thiamine diphosphokinase n=1 Tax=Rubricella aquisinus TaxID=2028108 RepID=A0A840WPY2_9RHOB|nr:thiamine diphosphokinase [Rubricella aquisinus]MBB5516123.1 thiamine pyrophosphokinase [Rubricella aquisinus]
MNHEVTFDHPVLLVGGGEVTEDALRWAETLAPVCIAADGGADKARALGRHVSVIIGDLDSLEDKSNWITDGVTVLHDSDQNSTDFDKCLKVIRAPLILGVGFTGARMDHMLAVLGRLGRGDAGHVIILGQEDVACLCPSEISLPVPPGTRISLFPLGACRGVRSRGLHWPIDGLEMTISGQLGTSNRATGPVEITMDGPCLLIVPTECLPMLATALMKKD